MKNPIPHRTLHLYLAAAALVLSATGALAQLDPGIFELDGNAVTDHAGTALPDDWDRINPGPGSNALASSFAVDLPGGTIYTGGGSKDIQDISQWQYTSGSVPGKDDLTDAYAAAYSGSTGDVLLYFGADRFDNSGDSQLGFWFFQNQITLKPPKGNGTGGFNGVHRVGDILILSDFTTGGTVSTIRIYEWVGSGGSDGPLNLVATGAGCDASLNPQPNLCAIVNAVAQPAPWTFQPKSGPAGFFPPGQFFEGGTDLTKVLPNLECFASFLVETRSSQSVTATLKDFVLGPNFPFAPTVSVGNRAICQGGSTTLTAAVSGGIGTPSFSWTGPNGFTANTQVITVSTAGTYTVTVTTSLNCQAKASGVLTVNPNPVSTITPASAEICAGGSQMFTASITSGGTAPFQFSWTGPNNFTSTSAAITVATSGTYTVNITDANGCTTSKSANLVVNPNPMVSIGGPTGCQTVPAMLTANVTGGTGTPTFSWTGPGGFHATTSSISPSTGGTYSVLVTDSKGCQGQASVVLGLCIAQ